MAEHQHWARDNFGHQNDKWLAKRMPPEYHDIYLDEREATTQNTNQKPK